MKTSLVTRGNAGEASCTESHTLWHASGLTLLLLWLPLSEARRFGLNRDGLTQRRTKATKGAAEYLISGKSRQHSLLDSHLLAFDDFNGRGKIHSALQQQQQQHDNHTEHSFKTIQADTLSLVAVALHIANSGGGSTLCLMISIMSGPDGRPLNTKQQCRRTWR